MKCDKVIEREIEDAVQEVLNPTHQWVQGYIESLNEKALNFKELLDNLWDMGLESRKERRFKAAIEKDLLPEVEFLWEVRRLFGHQAEFDGVYIRRLDGTEREYREWLPAWLAWASNGWADNPDQLENLVFKFLYDGYRDYDELTDYSQYNADVVEDIDYGTMEIKLTSDDYAAIEEDLGWSVLPPYPRA